MVCPAENNLRLFQQLKINKLKMTDFQKKVYTALKLIPK